jgi:hypothetical protein
MKKYKYTIAVALISSLATLILALVALSVFMSLKAAL